MVGCCTASIFFAARTKRRRHLKQPAAKQATPTAEIISTQEAPPRDRIEIIEQPAAEQATPTAAIISTQEAPPPDRIEIIEQPAAEQATPTAAIISTKEAPPPDRIEILELEEINPTDNDKDGIWWSSPFEGGVAPAGGTHDNPLRRVLTTRSTPRSPEALGVNPNADSDSTMLVAQALEKKADGMFFFCDGGRDEHESEMADIWRQ